jgi:hypothetical protein
MQNFEAVGIFFAPRQITFLRDDQNFVHLFSFPPSPSSFSPFVSQVSRTDEGRVTTHRRQARANTTGWTFYSQIYESNIQELR